MSEIKEGNPFSPANLTTETEVPEVNTIEEASSNAEIKAETVPKKRTRRKSPPTADLLMEAMIASKNYNLDNTDGRERFLFDLVKTVGDAILQGEVHCGNREIMTKLLLLSILNLESAGNQ